ncbi:MAG: hypothetical protein GF416_08375 [Candidatus Altiarchaeales archaeon]|nr:hypothetical protein [Candidatus Altiarchaeales archaeon]MBD3417130.1 hypothetical protein [Candidatus Altiarchaeales archaeon]
MGAAAGNIFNALSGSDKPMTYAALKKKTKLDDAMLSMGLGWLAREDKIMLAKKARSITVQLR